jgi:hypothetical protein
MSQANESILRFKHRDLNADNHNSMVDKLQRALDKHGRDKLMKTFQFQLFECALDVMLSKSIAAIIHKFTHILFQDTAKIEKVTLIAALVTCA